jgi:magnesium chelatase family protein
MYRVEKKGLLESVTHKDSSLSRQIREQIRQCWDMQFSRCRENGLEPLLNGEMNVSNIREHLRVPLEVIEYAVHAGDKMQISARGLNKLLRVARTIADLGNECDVLTEHVAEAIQYRYKGNEWNSTAFPSIYKKGR